MSPIHPASLKHEDLEKQCSIERTRRSGPGGQHRNKVESAIVITHLPTRVRVEASERRSQHENLAKAWKRLRLALALHHREPVSPEAPLNPLWKFFVKKGKIAINSENENYPTLLALALDTLVSDEMHLPRTSERLEISTSQFVKLLQGYPAALQWVNEQRRVLNLRPLH